MAWHSIALAMYAYLELKNMRHSVGLQLNVQESPTWALLLSGLSGPGRAEERVCSTCTIVMQMNVREKSIVQRRPSLRAWPHFPKVTEGYNVCRARVESLFLK